MQRRWLLALLVICILTVLGLQPQSARAMPPPGAVRVWLLSNQPSGDIERLSTFFHDPCDVGSTYLASYTDADGTHNCSSTNKVFTLDVNQPLVGNINLISERFPGQSIAYTIAVWLKANTLWTPASGGKAMLFSELPHFVGLQNQTIDDDSNRQLIFSRIDPQGDNLGSEAKLNDPLNYHLIGDSFSASQASGDATGRPDLVMTILYKNLPDPVNDSEQMMTSFGSVYLNEATTRQLGRDSSSFTLKKTKRKQTISVEQGDIFIGQDISNRLLPNDHSAGQMVITRNGDITNANKCSWLPAPQQSECSSGKLTQIGAYTFTNTTTNAGTGSQEGAARDALRNAINKAAQENAQLSTGNLAMSDVQPTIRNFLIAPQTRWRYPNGQMLIFTQPINGDVTNGSSIQVLGKKVVVFAGGGNIFFNGTINTSFPAKVAFISLGNSTQTLIGPAAGESGGGSPHFEGAYVALDVTRDNSGNFTETGQINIRSKLGVDSNSLTIKGLLAATNINVERQVVPTQEHLVNLLYDSTFAQGNLIGLSSLIRPLASGAK